MKVRSVFMAGVYGALQLFVAILAAPFFLVRSFVSHQGKAQH